MRGKIHMNQTRKVTKAVIPVAGLGTRFLPATKAMPKEMLTVVNKPLIQYAVEEGLEAGIREFIMVTGRGKSAIENHFDKPYELSDTLQKKGKLKELESVEKLLPKDARIYYTRQGEPLGLGHAVHRAAAVTCDEPFVVILPDDIISCAEGNPLKEMIALYEETGKSVVMTEEVPMERTRNYGVLDPLGAMKGNVVEVKGFVEKPEPDAAPSNLAVTGRYVLSPLHMRVLAGVKPGKGGEIQLTDAMAEVCRQEGFMGYRFDGHRFDCGDKVGFQMANLYFALRDPYIAPLLKPYVLEIAAGLERRGK
jgi:UTP--glucose-1-phosphate uridylyltransferase